MSGLIDENGNLNVELLPIQEKIFLTKARIILAHGSRGISKTSTSILFNIAACLANENLNCLVMRESRVQLRNNYFSGDFSFPALLRPFVNKGIVKINMNDLRITFKNGSVIHCMHAENTMSGIEEAKRNLIGLSLTSVTLDEVVHINQEVIEQVLTSIRVGNVKFGSEFWEERLEYGRVLMLTNPGGISHEYLKQNYVKKAPPDTLFYDEHGRSCIHFTGSFRDNKYIKPEEYEKNLMVSDAATRAYYLEGNWDAAPDTNYFNAYDPSKNLLPSDFIPPESWSLEIGYDPGYSSPGAVVVIARVSNEENLVTLSNGVKKYFPPDSVIVYKEIYFCQEDDNKKGLQWSHDEYAEYMKTQLDTWEIYNQLDNLVADNTLWASEHNAIERYEAQGLYFEPADKRKGSRVAGFTRMKSMIFEATKDEPERPGMWFVQDHTYHTVRTLVSLPTDKKNPDDIQTLGTEDHLADALRYVTMSELPTVSFIQTLGI